MWNHAVFSRSRDRLLNSEVAQRFLVEVNWLAKRFMSDEQFTVDGTLIDLHPSDEDLSLGTAARASQKSLRRKDGSDDGDSRTSKPVTLNDTDQSTTDPEAQLYEKSSGKESRLSYLSHVLVENRNGSLLPLRQSLPTTTLNAMPLC